MRDLIHITRRLLWIRFKIGVHRSSRENQVLYDSVQILQTKFGLRSKNVAEGGGGGIIRITAISFSATS